MDSEDNKDLEIVMGGDSDIEISSVGDITNDLKPNTSKEKKTIIIPISMNKSQNSDNKEDEEEKEDNEVENEDSNDEKDDENNDNNEE